MFGIGTPELILILVVALLILGPKKLPEVARAIGKGFGELRKATDGIRNSVNVNRAFHDFMSEDDNNPPNSSQPGGGGNGHKGDPYGDSEGDSGGDDCAEGKK
ncbi:MAG: twin-arginine translocase TatA/TatE family subunit [Deltaproteobacteria bacterium]|uniref:Twin-arginine translocase TatA/TatE family subunit n=1 Tax=Candidatus Zymogenus saltonus TaxID=2844893 RepID=A0A9D8PNH0_9DELT|nr:twin-arginine translocase TatA/TatE family subunit [Candidatus Zymogenus saltonus]